MSKTVAGTPSILTSLGLLAPAVAADTGDFASLHSCSNPLEEAIYAWQPMHVDVSKLWIDQRSTINRYRSRAGLLLSC